jgi:hypothetical protein
MLALGVVYTWVLLTTPSDGTLVAGVPPFQLDRGSITLVPLAGWQGHPASVRVVAIQGRTMTSWLAGVLNPGLPQPHWTIGQTLLYTFLLHNRQLQVPVRLAPYPLGAVAGRTWGLLVFAATFLGVAAFVYARRPRERVALPLLLSACALVPATVGYLKVPATFLTSGPHFWFFVAAAVFSHLLFLAALLHAALVFPRAHPLVQRAPWLVPLVYLVPALAYAIYLKATWQGSTALTWFASWALLGQAVFIVYLAVVVAVLVSAYLVHRDAVTRQQIRWVLFGGAVAAGGTLLLTALPALVMGYDLTTANAIGVLQTLFPITMAIAILRYRLFDIDVIINRTLVYGTLTGTLAAVYFGSVVLLQAAFRALTGQGSAVAVVVSTLAIIALFQPVRGQVQTIVDRRFYRHKYDAALTLAAFGVTLRMETDLGALRERLLAVVEETMQPSQVSPWLARPPSPSEPSTWQRVDPAAAAAAHIPKPVPLPGLFAEREGSQG